MRICRLCKCELELNNFFVRRTNKDGEVIRRSECKGCLNTVKKEARQKKALKTKVFVEAGNKVCTCCELTKPIEYFPTNRGRCKTCDSKIRKESRTDEKRKREREAYANLAPEKKEKHIAKKSALNKKRFEEKPDLKKKRKVYNKSDRGLFASYRQNASRRYRNYTFELSFTEFSNIINDECFYCGVENSRGCDRVNNSRGYVIENCVPCCGRCNEIKMNHTVEDTLVHITKMVKHLNKRN